MSQVTKEQIDSILPFLKPFEADGFSAGAWNITPGQMPWLNFDAAVLEFRTALYDNGGVTPSFDWSKWQEAAKEYVDAPENIESADAEIIRRLFTTHVRMERFCEGHLAAMFENGHIVALLRRSGQIRSTIENSP